ncbi:MAG: PrgI family protein [Candidatus Kaiserbacteria bacterium]|nr:PrgI family protein [Candidatus Kaiserbacteria bacterium]
MEYHVPQFIEVEDKIIGPLTLRQFIYIAGATGLCVTFFAYFSFIFAVLFSLPVAAFAAALAFYRVNGKSFIEMLEAGFNYYVGAKLFLWKHHEPMQSEKNVTAAAAAAVEAEAALKKAAHTPRLTRGRLSDLAWSLDVTTPHKES